MVAKGETVPMSDETMRKELNELKSEVAEVKQIVCNGLRDRTQRIEKEIGDLKKTVEDGFTEVIKQNGELNRRIDKCVLKEDYQRDVREHMKSRFDKWFQVFIVIISVSLAGLLGYIVG